MALHQSDYAKGIIAAPYPAQAGMAVAHRFAFAVPATIAANDIIELAPIPPGCRVIDMVVDSDDLDSNATPTIALDVGIMSGAFGDNDAARTCGDEFFADSTVAQAGGVARPTAKGALRTTVSNSERSIGVKVATAAATAAAGTLGLTVIFATE